MRSYLLKQPSFPRIAAATELALPVNAGGYTVILEYRTRSLFEEFSKCTVPVTVYSTYCRAIQLQYSNVASPMPLEKNHQTCACTYYDARAPKRVRYCIGTILLSLHSEYMPASIPITRYYSLIQSDSTFASAHLL